jgi:hypothetical protein
MSWQEAWLRHVGQGLFTGISFGDWLALLRENRFAVDRRYRFRAACITLNSLAHSALRWYEDRVYRPKIQGVSIQPPLFVLGHWRNGTTHLHNLLTLDTRFASPTMYQVHCPHTCLTSEAVAARLGNFLLPRT